MSDTIYNQTTMIFNKEQCDFIIKNYPNMGAEYCANALNIPLKLVKSKINKLRSIYHFKLSPEMLSKRMSETRHIKAMEEYSVNPSQFLNIETKEVAYLLGLIWADGYVYKQKIAVEMVKEDLEQLKSVFESVGKWSICYRTRKNRKPQMCISTSNRILTSFLMGNDYISKGSSSADKILSRIPDKLKHYWFRGLIDGDGCFYMNKKNSSYQFSISSSYNQDWSFLENLFASLGIRYNPLKKIEKTGKSSYLRVTTRSHIKILGEYIYQNFDNMGLRRKYEKFKSICDGYPMIQTP